MIVLLFFTFGDLLQIGLLVFSLDRHVLPLHLYLLFENLVLVLCTQSDRSVWCFTDAMGDRSAELVG